MCTSQFIHCGMFPIAQDSLQEGRSWHIYRQQNFEFQYAAGKEYLLQYSSIFNFTHTSKLKGTSAHSISETNRLMPVAISMLLNCFNHESRMAASALSAGAELTPQPCQGLLGRAQATLALRVQQQGLS